MLEIRNLTKVYKAKGGVTTKALDGVSIKFPSKGLVFLLGKSGSGKSTLLNVTGGLDKPDDGEIIIKGRNSKSFSSSDFDSYRNTYIGFIFQEYNILNEFNVEQNISLALQLQGKKNDKAAVDKILEEVDLSGFGKRKPNTLSGGQKQRIAIARALIKNPEIIMADEPTGALDSNTGKQVFDTLKKLSLEKLIIVVSHDRDFAEIYGDRIIELSDGKVISDVTKEVKQSEKLSSNVEIVNENIISIKNGKEMTKEEFDNLYSILKENPGEILISRGEKQIPLMKQVAHIRNDNKSEIFYDTKEVKLEEYDGSTTKFIKSRLPFKRAFKMGSSSLKSKPIRMLFTIFLTIVSLTMFGVASTLLLYDSTYTVSTGLEASVNDYEAIGKSYERTYHNDIYDKNTLELSKESNSYKTSSGMGAFTADEINELNSNNVGHYFTGVYGYSGSTMGFEEANLNSSAYYRLNGFTGYVEAGLDELERSNVRLYVGSAPTEVNQVAISKFAAESLVTTDKTVSTIEELVGKEYVAHMAAAFVYQAKLKITGIYDCGQIPSKFSVLKDTRDKDLEEEYEYYLRYSYHAFAYVCKEFHDYYGFRTSSNIDSPYFNSYAYGGVYSERMYDYSSTDTFSFIPAELASEYLKNNLFYDFDGNKIDYVAPKDNEIYIPSQMYYQAHSKARYNLAKRCSEMLANPGFSDKLKAYLTDDKSNEYSEAIDILYMYGDYMDPNDFKNEMDLLTKFYSEYYKDFIYHQYFANRMLLALSEVMKEGKESEINYNEINNLCSDYCYQESNRNDLTFDKIKQFYTSNQSFFDEVLKRVIARDIANHMIVAYYNNDSKVFSIDFLERKNSEANEVYNLAVIPDDLVEEFLGYAKEYYPKIDGRSIADASTLAEDIIPALVENKVNVEAYLEADGKVHTLKAIGYTTLSYPILSVNYVKSVTFLEDNIRMNYTSTEYKENINARYNFAITRTDYSQAQIKQLLQSFDTYQYVMTNRVYAKVSAIVSTIELMQKVFLIIGVVFAVFASLMLFNFISSSISSKIKEIGILRAIGTRGTDLFKIFFSESGIIAIICFTISIAASIAVCIAINNNLASGLGIKLLNFNYINALIIIGGSILIAIIGTFIPVFISSKKAPIESIRTL